MDILSNTLNNQDAMKEALKERMMALSTHIDIEDDQVSDEIKDDKERIVGQGYYKLAKIYYDKADLENAEEYFLRALDKTVYPKDCFAMFKCFGFLIRIYSEMEKENDANFFIKKADELAQNLSSELGSLGAEYFYNLGMVQTYKGDKEQAYASFKLAYQKAQVENEPELIAKSLFSTANCAYQLEKHTEALNFLSQLGELLEILQKGYLKGSMHQLYGAIYKDQGLFQEALKQYDLAIKFLQHKNCWNLYGYSLMGKGITYKKMGEFKDSLTFFNLATITINHNYKRLLGRIRNEVDDVNDSSVDLYLDRHNRVIHERDLGQIDFKHRFVLLEILFLLAKTPGKPFSKDDLSLSIWKDEYNPLIHDKLIYTSISRLRKLIEPKGSTRKYILRGKDGYTFNPRVNARFHKEGSVESKNIGNIEINSPV